VLSDRPRRVEGLREVRPPGTPGCSSRLARRSTSVEWRLPPLWATGAAVSISGLCVGIGVEASGEGSGCGGCARLLFSCRRKGGVAAERRDGRPLSEGGQRLVVWERKAAEVLLGRGSRRREDEVVRLLLPKCCRVLRWECFVADGRADRVQPYYTRSR